MTREHLAQRLFEMRIPQQCVAALTGISLPTVSRWFRQLATLPDAKEDLIFLFGEALLLFADETNVPVDWSKTDRLRPIIAERVAALRSERSRKLRDEFLRAGQSPAA